MAVGTLTRDHFAVVNRPFQWRPAETAVAGFTITRGGRVERRLRVTPAVGARTEQFVVIQALHRLPAAGIVAGIAKLGGSEMIQRYAMAADTGAGAEDLVMVHPPYR